MEKKIKNLRRENDTIYWTVVFENWGEPVECNYRTNEAGEGIFEDAEFWYSKQRVGTCDFQLKQKTLSGIRKALNKYYED